MPTFLAPLDLTGNELRNFVVQNLATDPATPAEGAMWYDATARVLKYRSNTATVSLGPATADVPLTAYGANTVLKADTANTPVALTVGPSTLLGRGASGAIDALTPAAARTVLGLGALATLSTVGSAEIADGSITNLDIDPGAAISLSKLATDPLARANHTGTQLAATISNFDTAVRTSRLDQMAPPTATVSMNGQVLSALGTPVAGTDATNKAYVDNVAQGLDVKASVRVATAVGTNILGAPTTIDGVTMAMGDRVLLMGQSPGQNNGIYVWSGAGATMPRSLDADATVDVTPGMFTFVEEGATYADKGFVLTTDAPITLGVTPLTFTQFSGGASVVGTANRITVTGSQVDIAATYVGQASITTVGTVGAGTWQGTPVGVAYGGTGATTAAGAKASLGFITRATLLPAPTFGNASATSFTLTHNLNTLDVQVEIYDVATNQTVYADVIRASVNTVTISGFLTAPGVNALRAVVTG